MRIFTRADIRPWDGTRDVYVAEAVRETALGTQDALFGVFARRVRRDRAIAALNWA